nr:MAG TPA: hypothetical protein [Caudoviricetes sp.]
MSFLFIKGYVNFANDKKEKPLKNIKGFSMVT